MKKTLIFFDQIKFDKAISEFDFIISQYLQPLLDSYNKADIPPLEKTDIIPLLSNPREFIVGKLVERNPIQIGGMKVSIKRASELLELSGDQNETIRLAINISKELHDYRFRHDTNYGRNTEYFIISGEKVIVENELLERIKNDLSIYTENERQNFVLDKLNQMADLINLLVEEDKLRTDNNFFEEAFIQTQTGGKVVIRPSFIKTRK